MVFEGSHPKGDHTDDGTADTRKPWQTPVVITPARVSADTAYKPGLAGDSYSFYNVTS